MYKKNAKYPIEIAIEKNINKIGKRLYWSIGKITKYIIEIPRSRQQRSFKMLELILASIITLSGMALIWSITKGL